jgi:flagellar protein FliJ
MPAKFKFYLQPLLDWRKRVADEKQREFASCRRALDDCSDELERLAGLGRRCAEQLAAAATGCAADLRLRDAHLRSVDAALARQRRRLCELQTACELARDELVAASRDRRVLERLSERRRQAFEAQEARRDELELDESNARSHDRDLRERPTRRRAESAAP